MKKIVFIITALFFTAAFLQNADAVSIRGTAPVVTTDLGAVFDDPLNAEIQTQFNKAIDGANEELAKFTDFSKLTLGFANANAYAAQAGTLQGYQDYDIFAVSTGIMVGMQLPGITDYNIPKKLDEQGDAYAGFAPGITLINIGINTGFILDGLYFNVKYGSFSDKNLSALKVNVPDDLKFKSTIFGAGVNYSLVRSKSILFGFAKWRGLSLGTGFIYIGNSVDYKLDVGSFSENFSYSQTILTETYSFEGKVKVDPSMNLGIDLKTYTIPFDVSTSLRLLWVLNINLGAGVDMNFGSSKMTVEAAGTASAENLKENGPVAINPEVTPGTVVLDSGLKEKAPTLVRPRISLGAGFNLGPVKIDVPVTYYPASGYAFGVTAGIVW